MGGGGGQFKAKRKEWGKAQRQAGKCITCPETKPPSGEGTDLEAWGRVAGEEVGRALYSLQRFGVFSVGSEKRQRFLGHVCSDQICFREMSSQHHEGRTEHRESINMEGIWRCCEEED